MTPGLRRLSDQSSGTRGRVRSVHDSPFTIHCLTPENGANDNLFDSSRPRRLAAGRKPSAVGSRDQRCRPGGRSPGIQTDRGGLHEPRQAISRDGGTIGEAPRPSSSGDAGPARARAPGRTARRVRGVGSAHVESPDEAPDEGESNVQAQARGLAVVRTLVAHHAGSQIVLATHGNLLALVMNALDPTFGYEFWRRLSFPDIYQLVFNRTELHSVERQWDAA